MFSNGFLAWLLSLLLAFGAGASVGRDAGQNTPADDELQQKISDHMDVIVDEAAGIVDDVNEAAQAKVDELKESDPYKSAEEFVNNVDEIVDDTVEDIHAHFGPEDETETALEEAIEETETALEEAIDETETNAE